MIPLHTAAKQALDALETCTPGDYSTGHVIHPSYEERLVEAAITALREALAAPAPGDMVMVPPCRAARKGEATTPPLSPSPRS